MATTPIRRVASVSDSWNTGMNTRGFDISTNTAATVSVQRVPLISAASCPGIVTSQAGEMGQDVGGCPRGVRLCRGQWDVLRSVR